MQRPRGGYTIIEVMIVLAVGLVTFFAAASLLAGKQGRTEFSQAIRDAESQIESIINDVGVSRFPDASTATCEIIANRPRITAFSGGTGTGSNTDCIFLGKAIQIDNTGSAPHEITAYTVLGTTKDNTGQLISSFADANPSPVILPPHARTLKETYSIPFGATVLSARVTDMGPPTYLAGFYNSLQTSIEQTAQGSQSIIMKAYLGYSAGAGGEPLITQSIQGGGPFPQADAKVWAICFQSGTSNEKAKLTVNASPSGATTRISFEDCS